MPQASANVMDLQRPRPRVTLRDVARVAGVSVMSASRILRGEVEGSRADARERIERVREAARRLGYRRHAAAAATRQQRFGSVALVLSSSSDDRRSHLSPGLLAGLTEALEERNMHLAIARLSDEALTDPTRVPRLLREYAVDGLLINYNQWVPPRMNDLIEGNALPAVWLNDRRSWNAVYPDDEQMAREAVRHLLAAGHRRIAYFWHPTEARLHYSEEDRLNGFLAAAREAAAVPHVIEAADPIEASVRLTALLRSADRPTAILAYNAMRAAHALYIGSECDLRCPRDLSLVCFHAAPFHFARPVSVIQIPDTAVGREGVAMLLRRIESGEHQPARAIAGVLLPGATMAAPPGQSTIRRRGCRGAAPAGNKPSRESDDSRGDVEKGERNDT